MKILVVPDIHIKHTVAEAIISYVKPDKTIFTGDYFDSHEEKDSIRDNEETAIWLKESLKRNDRVHLLGNHDVPYGYFNWYTDCPGWKLEKHAAIDRHMKEADWNKLKFWHMEGNWLFTHAGFTAHHLRANFNSVESQLIYDTPRAYIELERGNDFYFYTRRESPMGMTWLRSPNNMLFVPIDGINQVFGHTFAMPPWRLKWSGGENHGIDAWLNYYGILEDGKFTVHKTPAHIAPPIPRGE